MRAPGLVVALAALGCELAGEQCSIDQVCQAPAERLGVGVGGDGPAAIADLDGDGAGEWITVSPALGTLTIARGAGGVTQTWSIGQEPVDLALADVDGDGRLDVAAPLRGQGALALLRGAGRPPAIEHVPVGPRPGAAAAIDLDGDGRAEVVVADEATGALQIVHFAPEGPRVGPPIASAPGPASLAAGDLSGDGRPDLAVARADAGTVELFLGTGDGGLRRGPVLHRGGGPRRTRAADLDDDGALDLALVDELLDEAVVIFGDGAGGARETRRWPVAAGPRDMSIRTGPEGHELWIISALQPALTRVPLAAPEGRTTAPGGGQGLAVGDLDGDGAAEVVVHGGDGGAALREAPGFGFVPWARVDDAGLAGPLAAGDLDGDGWLDLVVSDREHGEIALLRGQEGGFAAPVRSPGPDDVEALALADLDGDGAADVVAWRHAGFVTAEVWRAGLLWGARGVGERFEAPAEFEFAGDPRRVVAFDGDGDGRSELLALQARFRAPDATADGDDAGPGLLTLALADRAFALVDRAMSDEFAGVGDVLVGEFSPDHPGDELIRVAAGEAGPLVLVESRSAGRTWIAGALPGLRRVDGLARGDLTGDGIADLLLCGDDGLVLAEGRAWNAFAPGVRVGESGCDAAVIAELDGDGRADAITISSGLGEPLVEVRLGHALPWLPRLVPRGRTTASNRPRALAVADFDRDGRPDLAASGRDGLQVLRGRPLTVAEPDPARRLRAGLGGELQLGDLDGDGRDELVAPGRAGDVGVGMFDATGTMGPVRFDMSEWTPDWDREGVVRLVLDVDGDGVDELLRAAVDPATGRGVTELLRLRGGRLARAAVVPHAIEVGHAAPARGDLDGDGDDDLVHVDEAGVLVTHLGGPEGPGPARLGPRPANTPRRLQLADVDRDGRLDAVLEPWDDAVLVYLGDGRGGFLAAAQVWPMGWTSGALAVGDVDDDGFGDLVAGAGLAGAATLRVCHGGPGGPRGDCRSLTLGGADAGVSALAVEDIDGDGVTDLLAVLVQEGARSLVFGRGGAGRPTPHVKPLPRGRLDPRRDERGALRRATLDDAGPEWVYVDDHELTRLGVRAR